MKRKPLNKWQLKQLELTNAIKKHNPPVSNYQQPTFFEGIAEFQKNIREIYTPPPFILAIAEMQNDLNKAYAPVLAFTNYINSITNIDYNKSIEHRQKVYRGLKEAKEKAEQNIFYEIQKDKLEQSELQEQITNKINTELQEQIELLQVKLSQKNIEISEKNDTIVLINSTFSEVVSKLQKPKEKRKRINSLKSELTNQQIEVLHHCSSSLFLADLQQWEDLFCSEIRLKKPIVLSGNSHLKTLVYFLDSLRKNDLIYSNSYYKILEKTKCFSYNKTIVTATQYSDAKSDLNDSYPKDSYIVDNIIDKLI